MFIKYCVFSKNSRKFATSPSPALACFWLYRKLPSNRSDCTLELRWELWRSLSDVGEGLVALNCEKNMIFPEYPVSISQLFYIHKYHANTNLSLYSFALWELFLIQIICICGAWDVEIKSLQPSFRYPPPPSKTIPPHLILA